MSAVRLERVSKSFGATPVLDDLSLAIGDSALTAILGPSGSGKTTLLRLIAGFERVDRGSITIAGRVVDDRTTRVRPEHRGIGFVPQDGALFPHLSAAGNIGFGLPRRERHRGSELLELVGLAGLGDRYPHQLSGGQQQRVALARALAIRPGLILLDEPFSSLDAGLRVSLRRDVARVIEGTGTPAVIVTHDQDEALSLASRIVILDRGHIVGEGSPLELYSAPSNPQAARFLGEANLLPGKLSAGVARCAIGALDVRGGDALPDGAVTILIRPEQLRLSAAEGELDAGREGLATVSAIDYYGHDSLTELRLLDDTTLSARIAGVQPLRPGDRVRIETEGPVIAWAGSSDAGTGSNAS